MGKSISNTLTIGGCMKNQHDTKFKGVNSYCKECKKNCKQFENVDILSCPLRVVRDPENQPK